MVLLKGCAGTTFDAHGIALTSIQSIEEIHFRTTQCTSAYCDRSFPKFSHSWREERSSLQSTGSACGHVHSLLELSCSYNTCRFSLKPIRSYRSIAKSEVKKANLAVVCSSLARYRTSALRVVVVICAFSVGVICLFLWP